MAGDDAAVAPEDNPDLTTTYQKPRRKQLQSAQMKALSDSADQQAPLAPKKEKPMGGYAL